MMSVRLNRWAASVLAAVVLACTQAWAVRPATWNHTTEADFAQGKCESIIVTSQGELTLGRELKVLSAVEASPAVVSAIAVGDKTTYVAAGDKSVVYRLEKDKLVEFARPPGTILTCLLWTGQDLLAGTGGDGAGIYRIDPKGAVAKVWSEAGVKYVWAIVPAAGNVLYAATGSEGKVFAIDLPAGRQGAAGKAETIWQAGDLARNVLCLALGEGGLLYAGTDTEGLVVEIDLARKAGRVILDAAEKEISALAVRPGGGVYAATADLAKVSPDGSVPPSTERAGRPGGTPMTMPGGDRPGPHGDAAGAKAASQPAAPAAAKPGEPKKDEPKKPADVKGDAGGAGAAAKPPAPTSRPAEPPKSAGPPAGGAAAAPQAPPQTVVVRQGPPPGVPTPPPGPPPGPEPQVGNAVYFIAKNGLVKTVFRRPVAILTMLSQDNKLILGTGNSGVVYSVSPDEDEIAKIVDTEAKSVTALAAGEGGSLLLGTSNRGSLVALAAGFAKSGTFTSQVLDAAQIAQWGTAQLAATIEGGSKITLATRSGNVAKADDKTWSAWSNQQPVNGDFLSITSPAARFLQYRLTLTGGEKPPTVRQVQLIHQAGNLAPEVSGVMVMPSARGQDQSVKEVGPKVYRHIMIRAADANQDGLVFDVECRRLDQQTWVKIAKEQPEPRYIWDTRTIGDGVYELRITASDSPNNPPGAALTGVRVSEPVIVDNTPPTIRDLAAKVEGGKAVLRGQAAEAVSRIVAIHYSLDGQDTWIAVQPTDGICDSQKEGFSFQTAALEAGTHLITVRVTDLFENTGYATVTVTK